MGSSLLEDGTGRSPGSKNSEGNGKGMGSGLLEDGTGRLPGSKNSEGNGTGRTPGSKNFEGSRSLQKKLTGRLSFFLSEL